MGRHGNWHADHVVALVNGGSTDLVNVQTLCVACHKLKTREDLAERDRRRHERAMADLVRLRVMPLDEAFGLPVGGALR
jgi:5-methylcytosine-specific restriction endonuclease McrA